jgi:hypothetical protein
MRRVRELARLYQWVDFHQLHSVGTRSGWPDLVLLSSRHKRALFAELKTERGKLSAPQVQVLELLHACGFETRVWRPSDWAAIVEELTA